MFYIYYDCKCCSSERALSLDELDALIQMSKCPYRELSVESRRHPERFYPSIEEMVFPKRWIPNEKWVQRELGMMDATERLLKRRRAELGII